MALSLNEGAAFHCYAGEFSDQEYFISAYPNKEVIFLLYSLKFYSDDFVIYRCTLPSVRAPSTQTGGLISSGTCTTCERVKSRSSEPDLHRIDSSVVQNTTHAPFYFGTLPIKQMDYPSYLDQTLVFQDVGLSCLSVTTSGS